MEILLLLLLIVGVAIVLRSGTPSAKGRAGERSVQFFTSIRLDGTVYRRIDNITLEYRGQTTQIDHVFVSQFGVFVVETKNMSGWIFGNEDHAQWTHKGGLVTYIRSFTTPVLSMQEVEALVWKIEQARLPATRETARKHVDSLKEQVRNISVGKPCPRCGAQLVLRTSKNGKQPGNQFLGCSGYPKCRFTRAVT